MKKTAFILCVFSALMLTTCKKMPELKVYDLKLTSENVAYSQTSAEIKVEYDYPTDLQYVNVTMSESNYFGYSIVAQSEIIDSVFIANFVDLHTDKKYYYKFEYSNGVNVVTSEVHSFYLDAALVTLPTVITMEVSEIQGTSAICGGEIIDDGGYYVTGRGVCWSTHRNPTIFDNYTTDGMDTGSYTSTMTGLSEHTVYYVRAFAINEKGTSYGTEYEFETTEGGGVVIVPTVTTSNVTDITSTSAICGGVVANSGGADVTARGVCWSTTENPTISDAHTSDGTGTGTFTSSLTNLTPQTTYYIRAYATNEVGTAYGEQKIFTAGSDITSPTVTTNDVSSVTSNSAVCGGNVTSAGNGTVTERGVCWSISENPTINDSHTNDGTGTGSYTSNITNLTENTTYYVRAFATNEIGTAYGEQKTFTTEQDSPNVPTGAINGLFTINENGDQVWFSQGNLQYQASTNTWRFAENQWDYVGEDNSNISETYSGWIDLFGWGTSGYNHGAVCYQPWSITYNDNSYYLAYGSTTYNLYDQTGQADWGYNAIYNGGNTINSWRTPTKEEFAYMFYTRETSSGIRFAKALVNGVKGIVLLPDNWNSNYYNLNETDTQGVDFSSNTISAADWGEYLEANGVIFFPCGGRRHETLLYDIDFGFYWSSTANTSGNVYEFFFSDNFVYAANEQGNRFYGQNVRLVRDAQ
jgi:hypothetical protein